MFIVEVDESKFGKRKYHRGHRVEGVWVIGGVERTASLPLVKNDGNINENAMAYVETLDI
jgi:hypothetical protein